MADFSLKDMRRKTGLSPGFSTKFKVAGQAKLVVQKLKFWNSLRYMNDG
jgi:hypothetical protein